MSDTRVATISAQVVVDNKGAKTTLNQTRQEMARAALEMQKNGRIKVDLGEFVKLNSQLQALGGRAREVRTAMLGTTDAEKLKPLKAELAGITERMRLLKAQAEPARKELERLNKIKPNTQSGGGNLLATYGPIAAIGTTIIGSMRSASKFSEELINVSRSTNLSTDTLQKLRFVTKSVGVDFNAAANTASMLQRKLLGIEDGGGKAAEVMKRLGIDAKGPDGQFKSMNVLFPEVIAKLQAMQNPTERMALAAQLFGRNLADIAPILAMTNEEYQKMSDKASLMSPEDIKNAAEMQIVLNQLEMAFAGVARKAGMEFIPVLKDEIVPLIQNMGIPTIKLFIGTLKALINVLGNAPSVLPVIAAVLALTAATKAYYAVKTGLAPILEASAALYARLATVKATDAIATTQNTAVTVAAAEANLAAAKATQSATSTKLADVLATQSDTASNMQLNLAKLASVEADNAVIFAEKALATARLGGTAATVANTSSTVAKTSADTTAATASAAATVATDANTVATAANTVATDVNVVSKLALAKSIAATALKYTALIAVGVVVTDLIDSTVGALIRQNTAWKNCSFSITKAYEAYVQWKEAQAENDKSDKDLAKYEKWAKDQIKNHKGEIRAQQEKASADAAAAQSSEDAAQRTVEATDRAKSAIEDYKKTIALNGDDSEVASLKYDLKNGSLKDTEDATKKELIALAEQSAAQDKARESVKAHKEEQIKLAAASKKASEDMAKKYQENLQKSVESVKKWASETAASMRSFSSEVLAEIKDSLQKQQAARDKANETAKSKYEKLASLGPAAAIGRSNVVMFAKAAENAAPDLSKDNVRAAAALVIERRASEAQQINSVRGAIYGNGAQQMDNLANTQMPQGASMSELIKLVTQLVQQATTQSKAFSKLAGVQP